MPEALAYFNGKLVPAADALLPVFDAGFVQGTTVAEQLRTFGGRLFRLESHLERLFHSLAIVEVDPGHTRDELAGIANQLVAHNHPLLAPGDDLGLAIFVTPGDYASMVERQKAEGRRQNVPASHPSSSPSHPLPSRERAGVRGPDDRQKAESKRQNVPASDPSSFILHPSSFPPRLCVHSFPLRFDLWADKYTHGQRVATTDVEQVSGRSWPPELKCRSRMHYYLADRAAARRDPGSRALVLDDEGHVVEATSANVVLYRNDSGLVLPPADQILPGISLAVLLELAENLKITHAHRNLKPSDVLAADEVFLTSTSPCIVPVTHLNAQKIGEGIPGPMFKRFLDAWSALVGVDIVQQAQRFARRA